MKLCLMVQMLFIEPLLKPKNTDNKPCFETAYLGKNVGNVKEKSSPKCGHLWSSSSSTKIHLTGKKVVKNGRILPNLVTLHKSIKN